MTAATAGKISAAKVPVWQSSKAAYRQIFRNFPAFATMAALPFVLSVALDIMLPNGSGGVTATILRAVASSLITSLFELTWLRFLLLGPATERPRPFPAPGRRLLLYLGYSLVLLLLFIPSLLLFHGVGDTSPAVRHWQIIAALIFYIAAVYLLTRFSLVYAWTAVDAPQSLRQSWQATAGNGVRIVAAMLLVAVPLGMTAGALLFFMPLLSRGAEAQAAFAAHQDQVLWVFYGTFEVLAFFLNAATCGVLAEAFKVLTGWEGDQRELLERFE